jgi:SDR family mycofactocin-dependent oxidoreductase
MNRFEGKVTLITGAAPGQGRSHAVRMASEGASLILSDIAGLSEIDIAPYDLGTEDDLAETARLCEEQGARVLTKRADVRSESDVSALVAAGLDEFGQVDVLLANAGIGSVIPFLELDEHAWTTMIDVNLSGAFRTIRAVAPHMVERNYGRIVATASLAGRAGYANIAHYVSAKWGVIGLVKCAAIELATKGITVNAVCPGMVDTAMIQNEAHYSVFVPGKSPDERTGGDVRAAFQSLNPIPVPWVEVSDVTEGVMFLASDAARYITGETMNIAAGHNAHNAV